MFRWMAPIEIRKVCCAVDFSDASRAAFRAAVQVALKFGAELTLLHVGARDARLAEMKRDAERDGVRVSLSEEAGNDPAKTIVEFANKGAFDMIVMGTRGLTGRAASFAGSVAEAVVRQAHCPVMTLHEGWRGAR